MKPLAKLKPEQARRLEGLVFDLDGTVLDEGVLSLATYESIHRLADSGLSLVLCTGRSAAWAQALKRQWPIALAVAENGGVAFGSDREGRSRRFDRLGAEQRGQRRARLLTAVEQVRAAHPHVPLADDNLGRLTDVTFDVGEHARIDPGVVAAMRRTAAVAGARTFLSSIHLHVTLDGDDKASGTVRAVQRGLRVDPSSTMARFAFVGDSENDAACFSAFRLTFAVANVGPHVGRLSRTPAFVSASAGGAGFAAIASRLLELRT